MTPFAVQAGRITAEHIELYRAACEIVASLEDGLTCHDVCEVVAQQLRLHHVRGYFTPGFEHSWCEIPGSKVVIDCYPILCASGPILVNIGGILNPWRRLYIESSRTRFAITDEIDRAKLLELIETTLSDLADLAPRICPECGGTATYREHDGKIVGAKCWRCGILIGWDQCLKAPRQF